MNPRFQSNENHYIIDLNTHVKALRFGKSNVDEFIQFVKFVNLFILYQVKDEDRTRYIEGKTNMTVLLELSVCW